MKNNSSLKKYEKYILPNGLKCILYSRKDIHSVSISVSVNVGSLDEDKDSNGLSHIIEHLAFDGTRDLDTWDKVDKFLNNISGSGNAYTSLTTTRYYGTFPDQYLEDALYYYSQLVFFPLHKKEDIDKERVIVLDEMKRYDDTVEEKVYENIIENRFEDKNTAFSYKVIGTQKNVKNFKKKDIDTYYQEKYNPANVEVYVIGNFNKSKLKKYLERYFYRDLKNKDKTTKPVRNFQKNYPEYSNFRIDAKQKKDIDQYYLTLSFPSYEFALTQQDTRLKVPFIRNLLASSQYQQSILWKRLREELGLVYGVSAFCYEMYNRSMFVIETSFNPEYLETVLREIYLGINKVKSKEVSDEIFQARKKRVLDTQLMIYDNPTNVLNWIIEQDDEQEVHKKSLTLDDYLKLMQEYKFEDIIKSSNDIFDWSKANIGIVTTESPALIKKKVEAIWENIVNS